MKIVLLTSSRADYGIYRPLIKKLKADSFFDLKIVAFGTHLSHFHGYTVQEIEKDGFEVNYKIESLVLGDSSEAISSAIGLTVVKFSSFWAKLKSEVDLIICLGDRYEMLAAVLASVPFQIPVAHLHGGEKTLGAIDDVFRHSLSLFSKYHFTSTEKYAKKIAQLIESQEHIYMVGALSLDNLQILELLDKKQFYEKYQIDLQKPTILFTFHPETVSFEKNEQFMVEISMALTELQKKYQIVVTMPNADSMGNMIREKLNLLHLQNPNHIFLVESFGTLGYFSCIKYCSFLLGNTSSGILEAASLGKYVINLGNRQEGREAGNNVFSIAIKQNTILETIKKIENLPKWTGKNLYGEGNTAEKIIEVLKQIPVNLQT